MTNIKWIRIIILIGLFAYPGIARTEESEYEEPDYSALTSYRDSKFRTRFYERSKEGFKTRGFDRKWRTKYYRKDNKFYDRNWRHKQNFKSRRRW